MLRTSNWSVIGSIGGGRGGVYPVFAKRKFRCKGGINKVSISLAAAVAYWMGWMWFSVVG